MGPAISAAFAYLRSRSGATSIEYAMIASIISIAIVVGAQAIGLKLTDLFFVKVAAGFNN